MKSFRLTLTVLVICLFSLVGIAQQSTAPANTAPEAQPTQPPQAESSTSAKTPAAQAPQAQTPPHELTSEEIVKEEEKQRALGMVPLFGMTSVPTNEPD